MSIFLKSTRFVLAPFVVLFFMLNNFSVVQATEIDSTENTLSLKNAIELALTNSVSSAIVENTKLAAYWRYDSYKANMLPEISFSGTLPSYVQSYSSYQKSDGTYTFLESSYLEFTGGLKVTQNIPLTGGTISLQTTLDLLQQVGSDANEFMSIPIALTLNQPIFGVNTLRWSKRIEPVQFEESQREYDEGMVDVALSTVAKYFNALLSKSQMEIARENLKNSEELFRVAKGRQQIGDISVRDLSQLELQALQAKATLTSAESSFRAQMFQLRAFLALSEEEQLAIETPLEVPSGKLSYQSVLDYAMENSSFAKSVIRRSLEAEYEVATAKGNRRSINLYATFGYTGVGDKIKSSYTNMVTNQVVSVGLSVPILDWGKRKADVMTAESNRNLVESQITEDKMSFKQEIFLLVENFNNQAAQFEIASLAEKIAAKNYSTTFQTFLMGDVDILTLNDARERRDAASQKFIEEMYMYWNYYYQVIWFTDKTGNNTFFNN
ncbi:MAG: TolC family protein [Rikenellaceae bacterium]